LKKFLLLFLGLFVITFSLSFAAQKVDYSSEKLEVSDINTEHLVYTKILYDEIYDIDISEGHYRASVEVLLAWEDPKTEDFLAKFGDEIIHGEKLEEYLNEIWYPEFFISNAETPRTVHYKTLDVLDGKFELFERFDAELSIDAEMPKYPFGNLDLFLDIASFSGNKQKMVFYPESIEIGHHDAHHKVLKGNWEVEKTILEEEGRTSLNHGGHEKFSYLIAHVNVTHGFIDALQKILFPIFSVVFLSLLINHVFTWNIDMYNWRIGAQLTLFLTIPALKFSLAGELPTTHYLNFTDALFIWATFVVTFNLIIGIISKYSISSEGNKSGLSLETFAKISSPLTAILVIGLLLYYIFA
jgi:hypothetical protein